MIESVVKTRINVVEPAIGFRVFTCTPFPLNDPEVVLPLEMLGKRERVDWETRFRHPGRRNEWLAGRLAAKVAFQDWFDKEGREAPPADQLEILNDDQGAPYYAGPWKIGAGCRPDVSITHTDTLAAAVVHPVKKGLYPGLDLERRSRQLSDRFIRDVFTLEEEAMIGALPRPDRPDWRLRLWCAREAAAKSLRRALVGSTRHFRAEEIDFEAGTVYVAIVGLPQTRPLFGNKCMIPVKTWLHESYIMAVSLIQ